MPKKGRRWAKYLLFGFVAWMAIGVAISTASYLTSGEGGPAGDNGSGGGGLLSQAEVTTPLTSCDHMWKLMRTGVKEQWQDDRAGREFLALADTTKAFDAVQATNYRAIANADSPADSSANLEVAYRRCVTIHDWPPPSQAEIEEFQNDAKESIPTDP
jgi:hypothetical protein